MYNSNNLEFLKTLERKLYTKLNVCLPGVIESYDFATQKANIKLDTQKVTEDGFISYPVISSVPVMSQSSGGAYFVMPVKPGDTCLVIFADLDITNWLAGLSNQEPATQRTHHISDAIAIIGLNSFAKPVQIENNTDVTIKYSNSTFMIKENGDIEITSANHIKVVSKTADVQVEHDAKISCKNAELTAEHNLKMQAENLDFVGQVNIQGDLHLDGNAMGKNNTAFKVSHGLESTGDVVADNISLKNHRHSYQKPVVGSQPTAAVPDTTGKAT